jgi:hypothetical protein
MNRYDRSPRKATGSAASGKSSSHTPNPPFKYTPDAPATRIALKVRRAGSRTNDVTRTKSPAAMTGPT